jgi:hypothetical protein
MTATEIKTAVDQGKTVFHQNEAYQVVKDKFNQYLIKCTLNGNCIGLTWADGETLNGKEADFYLKDEKPVKLYNEGQTVITFFNKKGTSCKKTKDQEHTEERKGKILKVTFDEAVNTFVLNVDSIGRNGFFLCHQENVIVSQTPTEIIKDQIESIFNELDFEAIINQNITKVLNSGAVDTAQIKANDYTTAKAILAATLENFSRQFEPLSREGKNEINNIRRFI